MKLPDPLSELGNKAFSLLLNGVDTPVFWRGFIMAVAICAYGLLELGWVSIKHLPPERVEHNAAKIDKLEAEKAELRKVITENHKRITHVIRFFYVNIDEIIEIEKENKITCKYIISTQNSAKRDAKHQDYLEICHGISREYSKYFEVAKQYIREEDLLKPNDVVVVSAVPRTISTIKHSFYEEKTNAPRLPEQRTKSSQAGDN